MADALYPSTLISDYTSPDAPTFHIYNVGDADRPVFTTNLPLGSPAPGPLNIVVNIPGPNEVAVRAGSFLWDFYYRIWVVPSLIRAQNPVIGSPISFGIWNAFPEPDENSIVAIIATDGDGLTFDFDIGDKWKAIEYKNVSITITPAAPINIDAFFEFDFEYGSGLLNFQAAIADFVQMVPDPPVVETWEWLTDIMKSRNGTEQRIAIRDVPRRAIQYSFMIEDEVERTRQYRRWYKSLATRIVLPYYQYSTTLTQKSSIGDSYLYFNPNITDMRDQEFVLLLDPLTNEGHLVKLATVGLDGASTDTALTFDARKGLIISPAFTSRLNDKGGITMSKVTGRMSLNAQVLEARTQFKRPGSAAVIASFDSLNVLDRRPLAEGDVPENFDQDIEVLDFQSGVIDIKHHWPHPYTFGERQYLIQRLFEPAEFDWWRDFLDACKGRQNPFLVPTFRPDLFLTEQPAVGTSELVVSGSDFASLFFPYETYKRLELMTDSGVIRVKILDALDNGDGSTRLVIDTIVQPEWGNISMVSFLNLCRLNDDKVTIEHLMTTSILTLNLKAIDG